MTKVRFFTALALNVPREKMKNKSKNIFLTSDNHFGHAKCIEYCSRPFKDVQEMEEKLIRNWNKVVRPQDLVYVLGDFSMYLTKEHLREILNKLNGTKILVRGNHDLSPSEMLNIGFHAVVENAEIQIAKERVILSHYPYRNNWMKVLFYDIMNKLFPKRFYKPRKFVKQLEDKGHWLLYGHVHSKKRYMGKKMIHVGVDAWDFTPVSIQKIGDIIAQVKLGIYKEV